MKQFTKILMIILLGATLLQASAFEKVLKSRATQVTMSAEKPLTTGNNILNLQVNNKIYQNAIVKIKVFMPAMPGMPKMEYISKAKNLGNGKFTTNINFSMHGTWQVHIYLTPKNGKKARVKTSLNI